METIELKPFTPKWKKTFSDFSKILLSTPESVFIDVAHIGSTAIEGAPAKDIVDIQCAIISFEKMHAVKSALEPLGFTYSESFTQDHVPFHAQDYKNAAWEKRFFSGHYHDQKFHVHIRLHRSLNWKFAIQFRDFMIAHPEARVAYMQFKERLAASGVTLQNYSSIKDSVIDLLSLQFFKP